MECVCFTLIVDDIVLPHGETVMEVLGGGGPQTLFGYQLVTNQTAAVGLSAGVGPDLPHRCQDWLHSIGADTSGLVTWPRPTPRAWQVFEEWGRRTQIWRGRDDPCDQLYDMLRPKYDTMPPPLQRSANYHLGVHPLYPPQRLMKRLRKAAHEHGGVLSIEPYTAAEEVPQPGQVAELLALCDIFSPNEAEAESMVGQGAPEELARRLLALSPPGGADVVVVRCGPQGVLAARRSSRRRGGEAAPSAAAFCSEGEEGKLVEWDVEAYAIPAVPDTAVVDVTGCGNAFCGGFLAALYRESDRTRRPMLEGSEAEGEASQQRPSGGPALAGQRDLEASGLRCGTAQQQPPGQQKQEQGLPQLQRTQQAREGQEVAAAPAWLRRSDLQRAGAWGCVAASFMAEERGVPLTRVGVLQERSEQRFNALLPHVRPVELLRGVPPKAVAKTLATAGDGWRLHNVNFVHRRKQQLYKKHAHSVVVSRVGV